MGTRVASAIALVLPSLLAGCDVTLISISTDGQLQVVVTTTGSGGDGFRVRVDGGAVQAVGAGGTVLLTDLDTGRHSVQLSGVAESCRVEGANPRSVMVQADGTAQVAFQVRCGPAIAAA